MRKGKSGLYDWASSNFDEKTLSGFALKEGNVDVLRGFPDIYPEFEVEIENLLMDEAEISGWLNPEAYVRNRFAAEMDDGDAEELRLFSIRCALEKLLSADSPIVEGEK